MYRNRYAMGAKAALPEYENESILSCMKIGERGQVTIPKAIRKRFGLGPETEVEFQVVRGAIVLRKMARPLDLERWKGRCRQSFQEMGYVSVDAYIDAVRGR